MEPEQPQGRDRQSFREMLAKIARGEIKVEQLGSAGVAKTADPRGVADAADTAMQAQLLGIRARSFLARGLFVEAIAYLMRSLVLEDSIGNLSGIASDIGNLAAIYGEMGDTERAEKGFRLAVNIDRRLLSDLQSRLKWKGKSPEEGLVAYREYKHMLALHLDGLAKSVARRGDLPGARDLVEQEIEAFHESGQVDGEQAAREKLDWLHEKIRSGGA